MILIVTMFLLVGAMLFSLIRLIIGPTIWDRLLALNLISAKTILLIALYAVYTERPVLLDISLSAGIIGFLTITLFARFIIAGGRSN
ncbi:MAG: monovalent cation/H+ antiporter complex subunit F [Bacillota bacterium]|nr:monovalent cation/H+ antiporter complex subunit F [Bacillota bacterium]